MKKRSTERKLHDSPEAVLLREAAVAWTSYSGIDAAPDKKLLDAALGYAAAVQKAEDRLVVKTPSNACPARLRRCVSQDGACLVRASTNRATKNPERWCAYCGRKAALTPSETLAKARLIRRGRIAA